MGPLTEQWRQDSRDHCAGLLVPADGGRGLMTATIERLAFDLGDGATYCRPADDQFVHPSEMGWRFDKAWSHCREK